MEFRVLGPIEVCSDDGPVHVGGVKQRSILALLIASRGQVVSTDRIVDEVYGDDAGAGMRRSVQTVVSMLRRDLGGVIVGTGEGYRFDAPRTAVDACRFEDAVAAGLELLGGDPRRASSVLDEALALWRDEPYGDVEARGRFQTEVARLRELRFAALEARAEADLVCGRHREVIAELEALVGEYPLRERLWGWLMLALYRTGRQADALAAYQRLRTVLGEELGIEPCDEVRVLEEQILLHDPVLDLVLPIPHNLPASLTSFVGRDVELIEIGELLEGASLVTLTGAGGSGKTRLAVESARALLDGFPDGVWFVDFRGLESDGVVSLVASTSGVVTSGDQPLADQVVDALWSRRVLLILDNCEHVLDGVAPLVEALIRRDGALRVLATSREPLGVPGESMMLVRPLRVPERADMEDLASCAAAVLLSDRAQAVMPEFVLDEHLDAVFGICRAVEGLPLALELAAGRLRVFSPEEVAERLDDQLATLKTAQRSGDLRHATMEATIRWSWDLLDVAEQTLLSRLSVFHGTWSLVAAETICGYDPISGSLVADLVESLIDKSLVVVNRVGAGSTRYRLLEPIRQYASRCLDDEETVLLRHRLVDYWSRTLAESYEPGIRFAWRDHDRARALEDDQANLTAAVEWALTEGRFDDAMVIFASPFGDLLLLQGSHFDTATRWVGAAIERRGTVRPGVLLAALEVVQSISDEMGLFDVARDYAQIGIEAARTPEERRWYELAMALAIQRLEGHAETTTAVFRRVAAEGLDPGLRASALFAEAHNMSERGWMLVQQAMAVRPDESPILWDECRTSFQVFDTAEDTGRYDVAIEFAHRALDLSRRYGFNRNGSRTAARLACLYMEMGRPDEAAALIAEAVLTARRIRGPSVTNFDILEWAARVARLRGDLDKARCYVDEALHAVLTIFGRDDPTGVGISATVEAALIARDRGDLEEALGLLDEANRSLNELRHTDMLRWFRSKVRTAQASVAVRQDDPDGALQHLTDLLARPDFIVHLERLEAVDLAAIAFAQQGRPEPAARLKGAVDSVRDDCGLVVQRPDKPIREAAMRRARSAYDGDWEATEQQGRSMTLKEAVDLAVEEASSGRPRADPRDTITKTAPIT